MTSDRGTDGGSAELDMSTPRGQQQQQQQQQQQLQLEAPELTEQPESPPTEPPLTLSPPRTPVTPKSPGLNPNASVFLSKTPPTGQDGNQWEEDSTNSTGSSDNYQFVNGDVGKPDVGVVYPPTPESPAPSPPDFAQATETPLPSNIVFTPVESNGSTGTEENGPLEGNIPDDQLRRMLRTQLEYYFSRENLSHDTYLVSQMDSDQYVPIVTVANFNQVKRLTNNMELIVNVLRELANVQVDDKGEKVRPNHNRCIVILREVPESTPVEDVEKLFSGQNCPKFVTCEFARNDCWYVTFESDETAQRAYQYLREEVRTFLGKPIMARIKAKPLIGTIRPTYFPRNGLKPQFDQPQPSYQMQQQQQQALQPQPQPQPAQQQQQQQQQQQRYSYTQVPTIQYVNGGQQPFQFAPYNTIMTSTWPTVLDPSMVFAINGYQAQSVKINPNTGRHTYPSRARSINQSKTLQSRHSAERGIEAHVSHERYSSGAGSHRTSPRSMESAPSPRNPAFHSRRDSAPTQPHIHHPPVPAHTHVEPSVPSLPLGHQPPSDPSKDCSSLPQRGGGGPRSYRSRRRREEEGPAGGARNSRTNPSHISAKDAKEREFELESTSFPPLPGSSNSATTGDIFESKMSDVVKGTAKPGTVKETSGKAQSSVPSSPTTMEAIVLTVATTTTNPASSSITTHPATVASTPTTAPSTPTSTASPTVSTPTAASLTGSLPTPPPSPEKLETPVPTSKPEQKHEPKIEKSQKHQHQQASCSPSLSTPRHAPTPQTSHPSSHPAPSSHSHPTQPAGKGEGKTHDRETHRHTAKQAMVSTQQKSACLEDKQPVKLSYAQMVQRRAESEGGSGEKTKTEDNSANGTSNGSDPSLPKPHTLKEQSQTFRQAPANSKLPLQDAMRKDSDPKEQRLFNNRRAKENRERRDRRREREFDGRRSPNNNK